MTAAMGELSGPMEALRQALARVDRGRRGYDAVAPARAVLAAYDQARASEVALRDHHCDDQGCGTGEHRCDAQGCTDRGYGYCRAGGGEEFAGFVCPTHEAQLRLGLDLVQRVAGGANWPPHWEGWVAGR